MCAPGLICTASGLAGGWFKGQDWRPFLSGILSYRHSGGPRGFPLDAPFPQVYGSQAATHGIKALYKAMTHDYMLL